MWTDDLGGEEDGLEGKEWAGQFWPKYEGSLGWNEKRKKEDVAHDSF